MEFRSLKRKINKAIGQYLKGGMVSHVSVYCRDLNNGPWFGINEQEKFIPASLLKVPVLIACLKKAEDNPGLLKKKVAYTVSAALLKQNIEPSKTARPGSEYTLEELLGLMITDSDNHAAYLVMKNLDIEHINKVQDDLCLPKLPAGPTDVLFTIKEYCSYFRILYNASYINREMSELALSYLSRTASTRGIVEGVPEGTVVAHKFGERSSDEDDTVQFHDCGIVYYPGHPYLLCVMTRGRNMAVLSDLVAEISRDVYEAIDTRVRS